MSNLKSNPTNVLPMVRMLSGLLSQSKIRPAARMMKTIAIHQPNYLPWRGYFHKIAQCDVFVFLDDVEFTRRSFTRRVHIRKAKGSREKAYLIVPLKHHSDYAPINELEIYHRQNWQQKQLNQIANTYSGAPAYREIYPIIAGWMEQSTKFKLLSDWNEYLIREVSGLLGLSATFIRSSELPVKGKASALNLNIAQYLEGDIYLSGRGAKKYQREEEFRAAGIDLQYTSFQDAPYEQGQGEWMGGLSVLDGLMNGVRGKDFG